MSFKTTINELTFSRNSSIPRSALAIRTFPSKENGLETIPTVNIPISFANCAIAGIAPVPVPPPIPAVKNNKSVPCNIFLISSLFSIAALSPMDTSPPAPNPFVISFPICITFFVFASSRTFTSVLNS